MSKKLFPIKTETACQLKWAWSTLYLNSGTTRSCHRTAESNLTPENFSNFHNTEIKLADRTAMLNGKWPETNCTYCKDIEEAGGVSDRIRMSIVPDLSPPELEIDPTAIAVDPTLLEVYFNNTCNLKCIYCVGSLSSSIEAENKKFGDFKNNDVLIKSSNKHYKDFAPYFWQWFDRDFSKIRRLHILGGEPFYQKEVDQLLDKIELTPNPNCELNIVTNLMVSLSQLEHYVSRFKKLLVTRCLKRVDITCSIDCFGSEQEYVRNGIELKQWEENFNFLLTHKWLTVNINQTIVPLTIKTMPELLRKLAEWRQHRPVGHFFSAGDPIPNYLKLDILNGKLFDQDIKNIMNLLPNTSEQDQAAYKYMESILEKVKHASNKPEEIKNLAIYLDELDRRRNTNWRVTFPWLEKEYTKYVVQ